MLRAYGVTDKGRVRATNEDHFAIDAGLRLLVVADGMGGHNAGEVAARVAVEAIVECVRDRRERHTIAHFELRWPFGFDRTLSHSGNLLRTAIHLAHVQVREAACSEEYAGMGTTVVAVLVAGGRLSVGHVGDSRVYVVTAGKIRQLTRDDSWIADMLAHHPDTDPDALADHPMRNALTNVIGARTCLDVHVAEQPLVGGEHLVLSTDGVHGVLDEHQIEQIVLANGDLTRAPGALIAAALARGSRDNCTAVVAEYRPT